MARDGARKALQATRPVSRASADAGAWPRPFCGRKHVAPASESAVECEQEADAAQLDARLPVPAPSTSAVTFARVDGSNVRRLHELNLQLFPVRYNDAFYQDVVDSPSGYATLAYVDGSVVGAICCRLEAVEADASGRGRLQRTYIMTLGVLATYRRARIGSGLLEKAMAQSIQDGVMQLYLHVQTSNAAALRFYRAHGFEATQIVRNYYKRIEPPDCYVLRKTLTP